MTFLDSSVIIDYLDNVDEVVEFVDSEPQLRTSAICLYEVLAGELYTSGPTDIAGTRENFGRVVVLDLTESVALEAAKLQDHLLDIGEPMAPRDVMIAASAYSVGDELVVADSDFDTEYLTDLMTVTNLRGE
ncbi:PIN domain-containing protein [Halostella litorea]|uniref:PIN domain-containing protein n=1 Tax=Halostella litorea TaxID=2528831 RepID=UPI001092C6BA|nr:PIN domain-containing protein [Halostella litorea]